MLHSLFLLLILQICFLFITDLVTEFFIVVTPLILFYSSLLRFSAVNVSLLFNDSLINTAPGSPIKLSIKYFFISSHFLLQYLFYLSLHRFNSINVLFIFSASLSNIAPESPMLLSYWSICCY